MVTIRKIKKWIDEIPEVTNMGLKIGGKIKLGTLCLICQKENKKNKALTYVMAGEKSSFTRRS